MCLHKVYGDKSEVNIGYKYFYVQNGKPQISVNNREDYQFVEFGKWYISKDNFSVEASSTSIIKSSARKQKYNVGFHVFLERNHALNYFKYIICSDKVDKDYIFKVHFRDILSVGTNYCGMKQSKLCIVARQIMVVGPAYK